MRIKDDLGKTIHVVSQTDDKYQINGVMACAASGHTCMAFNSTLEALRNQRDWLTYARRDPDFDKGLPNKTCQSEKLHSAEAQRLFMDHTLNLFPPLVSPMAYPKGKMPAHIKEWYSSHWGRGLGEKELFEEGVKLMRWFAKPFSEIEYTKAGAVAGETVKTARIAPRVAQKAGKAGCKTTTGSQRGDDGDDADARGGASKRQRTAQQNMLIREIALGRGERAVHGSHT
jgi:hypothetical protein